MKKFGKLLSLLLSVCMIASSFTFTVFADETSGTCGEGVTWTLDADGNLVISGEGAMEDNYNEWGTDIKSVVIGDSITHIGESAFEYCYALESVTIGKSVESIGRYAFSCCDALEQVVIPDSVVRIGDLAFDSCESLKDVSFGSGVNEIGEFVFDYCEAIETITVSPLNETFHSSGNCLIETETKTLIRGCINSVIPSDGSVEIIGDSAFYGCYPLENITIPNTVVEIDDYAFGDCVSLKNITIPDSVIRIGCYTFSYCSSLENVKFGNSLETIDYGAFYECKILKEINIPDSVTYIECEAFSSCYSAETVIIGSGVDYIDISAFDYCYSIETITVSPLNETFHSSGNCLIETESKTLMRGCKTSIIPDDGSVEIIGENAFYGCVYLESINIPYGIKDIQSFALGECEFLENVVIPNSVNNIYDYAFCENPNLLNVYIPESVTYIGDCALGYYYDYDIDSMKPFDEFVIEGKKGTVAEEYAIINGITFVDNEALPDSDSVVYMDKSTMTMPNVVEKTTASDLASLLSEYGFEATITDKNGEALQSEDNVGTGCVVKVSDEEEYIVIVKGDVDGSGKINATDYLIIKNAFTGKATLVDEYFSAADVDNNQKINATDYLGIKDYLTGKPTLQ